MMDTLTVTTGSRLHFGPLSWKNGPPEFGGIGLMIDEPRTTVSVDFSEVFQVEGGGTVATRIEKLFPIWESLAPRQARFRVQHFAPEHFGFGSGTQLVCAAAAGLMQLNGVEPTAERLAEWTQRGKRSAIGLHGFINGGFLVDAGKQEQDSVGSLAARLDFPSEWTILIDRGETAGLSGAMEAGAFAELAPMSPEFRGRLCELVLRRILPGLHQKNFALFADALTAYGLLIGEFFNDAQGGVFADEGWIQRATAIQKVATCAVAQSSWGPAVCVVTETAAGAEKILRSYPNRNWTTVKPLNGGYTHQGGDRTAGHNSEAITPA